MAALDVELFVCERCRPIVGWSADYLLPTDKHPYRARNCKRSWAKLEEAEDALLAPGWVWEEARGAGCERLAWEVNPAGQQVDDAGWSYASSFHGSFEGGAAKGTMSCYVRWRRLVRTQLFAGVDALYTAIMGSSGHAQSSVACPNVDLAEVTAVGHHMLEAVAMASLYDELSAPAVVQLKKELAMRLAGQRPSEAEPIPSLLAGLVSKHRGVGDRVSEAFKAIDPSVLDARMAQVDALFAAIEREAFAVLAIRRLRPELCCRAVEEPHECPLRVVCCPHPKCKERFSFRSTEAHDAACGFKPLQCEQCGEDVRRGEMRIHAQAACPLREAKCAFHSLGCEAPRAMKDLPRHLDDCTQSHLLLFLRRALEQQEATSGLAARIAALERKTASHAQAALAAEATLGEKVSALEAKLAALDRRFAQEAKKLPGAAAAEAKKRADASAQETSKQMDSIVADSKVELASVKAEFAGMRTTVAEFGQLRTDLDRVRASMAALERRAGGI